MTTQQSQTAQPKDPRGAGTGREANATRDREYNQTVPGAAPARVVGGNTDYPAGDVAKGRIDPDNPDRPIAMRDRRAYLIDQAEKNQARYVGGIRHLPVSVRGWRVDRKASRFLYNTESHEENIPCRNLLCLSHAGGGFDRRIRPEVDRAIGD